MDKIKTDCIWVILKNRSARHFSSLWQIAWIKVVLDQNHIVCDVTTMSSVTTISSVKEFHTSIFEFLTRD